MSCWPTPCLLFPIGLDLHGGFYENDLVNFNFHSRPYRHSSLNQFGCLRHGDRKLEHILSELSQCSDRE